MDIGNYTVECVFGGSDGYFSSNVTTKLEIKQETTTEILTHESSGNSHRGGCPHGYSRTNECPTCYDIIQASEWAYLDPSLDSANAEGINTHNQIRQDAIKKRAELGI